MQIQSVYLCDYAFRMEGGKHSFIGMFEQFNIPALPFQVPPFFVVLEILLAEADEFEIRVEINDPNGKTVAGIGPARFSRGQGGTPTGKLWMELQFNGLTFSIPGLHAIEISVDQVVVHSVPLQVSYKPQQRR